MQDRSLGVPLFCSSVVQGGADVEALVRQPLHFVNFRLRDRPSRQLKQTVDVFQRLLTVCVDHGVCHFRGISRVVGRERNDDIAGGNIVEAVRFQIAGQLHFVLRIGPDGVLFYGIAEKGCSALPNFALEVCLSGKAGGCLMNAPANAEDKTDSAGAQNAILFLIKGIGRDVLGHRVGNGHIKRVVREGKRGGVALEEPRLWDLLLGERDEIAVPVDAGDVLMRIPAGERLGQRAGTAADLQNVGPVVDAEKCLVLPAEGIGEAEPAGKIQRADGLDVGGSKRVHRCSLLFGKASVSVCERNVKKKSGHCKIFLDSV